MFKDIDDLSQYVQGFERSLTLQALGPSIMQARIEFNKSIGVDIIEKLLENEGVAELVKSAIANYAMYRYHIFWAASKNNTNQSLYKYQYEAMREEYISIYWCAMDAIFTWLDKSELTEWKDSTKYKMRSSLLLKSAAEFDEYFQIDKSEYFFSKVQFLMRKVMDDEINPRMKGLAEPSAKVLDRAKRVLAYHTMAQAVMLFDVTELPKSIRNDVAHEYTKESSLMQVREKMKSIIMADVEKYYSALEAEVKSVVRGLNIKIAANLNEEKNSFYATL